MAAQNKNYETKEKEEQVIDIEENGFQDVPDVITEDETHPAERRRHHRRHRVSRSNVISAVVGFVAGAVTAGVGIYVRGKYGVKVDHETVRNVVESAPEVITG